MRSARKVAESGFYHVVTKGEADALLFFDNADRAFYTDELAKTCDDHLLRLRAYCLMSNHVHLLLEDAKDCLSDAMKQLNEHYAEYFKQRTGRTGHVFKNRYWSEPVENDAYLLYAMRYIHANPAAAGICRASAYPWSSVRDYLGRKGITDTDLILGMLGGRDGFIEFSRKEPLRANPFPGSRLKGHSTADELETIARSVVGDPTVLRTLPQDKRRAGVHMLAEHGFSGREISRLTGISQSTVSKDMRVLKGDSPL